MVPEIGTRNWKSWLTKSGASWFSSPPIN